MSKRLIIVGGGPGGYVAAIRAAQLGAEVHLIEKERLGGVCLNVGCIPAKALLHVAETYQAAIKGKTKGVTVDNARVDWPTVMNYKKSVVNRLVKGVEGLLKANRVSVHRGQAVLRSKHSVEVNGAEMAADAIILGVGSEPSRPGFPGADLPGVIDSTAALSLESIPESMIILGGGVIGVEFAVMYNNFGCKVTIVEMLPGILSGVDAEIVEQFQRELVRSGITFLTGARLTEVTQDGSRLLAHVEADGQKIEIAAEKMLVAVGRRPRTGGMGLDEIGITLSNGRIVVDDYFRTSIPSIYAVGDCSSTMMLAHVASAQGVAAVEHALGHTPSYYGHIIPACVYSNPEIACVGLTEEQARVKGLHYKVGVFQLSANGKAIIESNGTGMIKIIAGSEYGEIIGVHIWGPRATDLIAESALAIRLEATVDELISTIHAHPTIGEAIPEAALAADGLAIHWPPGMNLKTK
jgi:dihydrolipoamide dehydrogenase